ncbi:MAG: hypothetical protein U0Q07_16230 [Acidimicrobiales bacterium]
MAAALAVPLWLLAAVVVPARPAMASSVVQPFGIALSISADCAQGDVEITYNANGVNRQAVTSTSQDGTVLDAYESAAYKPVYEGSEYILTGPNAIRPGLPQPRPVPAAGTAIGVYVTLGDTPPTTTNAEFFLLYRCDTNRNDRGGNNVVLLTCVGDLGMCPTTAQEALAQGLPTTGAVTPKFTG